MSQWVTKFWSHIFVISTGLAALTHSTWTLSTMFGGMEPVQFSQSWWWWILPGFAIAFAFDVGQIAISIDLRRGERSRSKYIAFAVLAIAIYYLQWLYMASHVPLIPFGQGMSQGAIPAASLLRDFAVWIIPGLLPLATTLYTFSYEKPKRQPATLPRSQNSQGVTSSAKPSANIPIAESNSTRALPLQHFAALPEPATDAFWIAECPACGWRKPCTSERGQINSLNAHRRHCPAKVLK